MPEKSYFTLDEKENVLSVYRQLLRNSRPVLRVEDFNRMRRLISEAVETGHYQRNKQGINPVVRNLNTALILCDRVGLERSMLISVLLFNLVVSEFLTIETVKKEFGDDIAQLIRGLIKSNSLYAKQAAVESENFRKLLLSFAEDIRVIIIMIADRRFKKIIGGVLVSLQTEINRYITMLKSGKYTIDDLREMIQFLHKKLFVRNEETKHLEDAELALYLLRKLNRPIRVCGMVRNSGEPGGGPFIAYNQDGTTSLQILESSQIDMSNPDAKEQFESGTHFNPVDLVCAVRDNKGEKYDLPKYVDKNTGFISLKSKNGRELKALELPGLWNGAMSDWSTVFVEVPAETFNPVKTVNDLLRPQHLDSTYLFGNSPKSAKMWFRPDYKQ
jgi:hypothetical protein